MIELITLFIFQITPSFVFENTEKYVPIMALAFVPFSILSLIVIHTKAPSIVKYFSAIFSFSLLLLLMPIGFALNEKTCIENFAKSYPNHLDALRYKGALEAGDYSYILQLDKRWRDHLDSQNLIHLWQAVQLLPKEHYLRSRYQLLSRDGVMARDDYHQLISELIVQDVENANMIAGILSAERSIKQL